MKTRGGGVLDIILCVELLQTSLLSAEFEKEEQKKKEKMEKLAVADVSSGDNKESSSSEGEDESEPAVEDQVSSPRKISGEPLDVTGFIQTFMEKNLGQWQNFFVRCEVQICQKLTTMFESVKCFWKEGTFLGGGRI